LVLESGLGRVQEQVLAPVLVPVLVPGQEQGLVPL